MSADRWLGQITTGRLHLVDEDSVRPLLGGIVATSRCNSTFVLADGGAMVLWHVLCTRCLRLLAHDLGVLR